MPLILCLCQYALVEAEPGELAVYVQRRVKEVCLFLGDIYLLLPYQVSCLWGFVGHSEDSTLYHPPSGHEERGLAEVLQHGRECDNRRRQNARPRRRELLPYQNCRWLRTDLRRKSPKTLQGKTPPTKLGYRPGRASYRYYERALGHVPPR